MDTQEIPNITDAILEELAEVTGPLADKADQSDEHALLVLGVKYLEDKNHGEGVQTYFSATGFYGVIAEGLYAELADQIENGQPALFSLMGEVIQDLEEDYELDNDVQQRIRPTLN